MYSPKMQTYTRVPGKKLTRNVKSVKETTNICKLPENIVIKEEKVTDDSDSNESFSSETDWNTYAAAKYQDCSEQIVSCNNNKLGAGIIPCSNDWPGDYEFEVSFDSGADKSSSWTYSHHLNKLFINMNVSCKTKFKFGKTPPSNTIIRALPVFCKDWHLQDIVKRCAIHVLPTDLSNLDHPEIIDHFIRCESSSAKYETSNGRLSVFVPYESPQAGSRYLEVLFKYMCFSSCPEPLNRKPLQVIYTLEVDRQTVGRRTVNLRVCACPARDRKSEERDFFRKIGNKIPAELCAPAKKRIKSSDNEIYTLEVKGRYKYELLKKFLEVLDDYSCLPNSASKSSAEPNISNNRGESTKNEDGDHLFQLLHCHLVSSNSRHSSMDDEYSS